MGAVRSSCCHPRARLSLGDKLVNAAVGCLLPLAGLGEEGLPEEERLRRLQAARKKARSLNHPGYGRTSVRHWKVEEEELPLLGDGGGGTVRVLVHTPRPAAEAEGGGASAARPLVIWAHGGGMTIMDYKDQYGADLFLQVQGAGAGPFCWASVDYRLAPEAKFPKAVEDVVSVYMAMKEPLRAAKHGYDPARISLAGVSAGALVVGHAAVSLGRAGCPPACLVLLYPMVDPLMQSESHRLYPDLPSCPTGWVRWSWQALLADGGEAPSEGRLREASLLHADWHTLKGVRALNLVARYDPFYDDGCALGRVLESAGLEMEQIEGLGSHSVAHSFDPRARTRLLAWWGRALSA